MALEIEVLQKEMGQLDGGEEAGLDYLENKIFSIDPFISIDDGVGDLIEIAVEKGRKQNKKLNLEFVESMVVILKVFTFVQMQV